MSWSFPSEGCISAFSTTLDDVRAGKIAVGTRCAEGTHTLLMLAIRLHRLDDLRFLLLAGEDIAARGTSQQQTAFIMAASRNNFPAVRCLLDAGADINDAERNGMTALMWASYLGNFDMVQYLVERGADMRMRKVTGGKTALSLAALTSSTCAHIVKHLLLTGADPHVVDDEGISILQHLLSLRNPVVMGYALAAGVSFT